MSETEAKALLARTLEECVQDQCATGWEYTLTADALIPIPPELAPRGRFGCKWGCFVQGIDGWWRLHLYAPYSTDGCTAVADFSRGATLSRCQHELQVNGPDAALALAGPFAAHWAHDFLYQYAREIAKAWECSIWAVIRCANRLFDWHMRAAGTPAWQRRTYYAGVCLLGHQFAWVGRQWRALRGWFARTDDKED